MSEQDEIEEFHRNPTGAIKSNVCRRGSPILDKKGRIVAYMAKDVDMRGDWMEWSVKVHLPSDMLRVQDDQSVGEESIQRGRLWIEYERGQVQILGCEYPEDIEHPRLVFFPPMFQLADEPLSDDPAGIVTAIKIVRKLDTLRRHLGPNVDPMWDYLIDRYTQIADEALKP